MKKTNDKKILFLQIYGGGKIPGGTEVYLKNLLKEINNSHHKAKIYIATFNRINNIYTPYVDKVEDSLMTRWLESYPVTVLQLKFLLFGVLTFIWGLFWMYITAVRLVKKYHINFLYANGGILNAIVAYLIYRQFGIKYILHFHGLFYMGKRNWLLQKVMIASLSHATQVIANSVEVADDICSIRSLKSSCIVIKCFIDQQIFHPQDQLTCRRKLSLPEKELIILSTSRLEIEKRIGFFMAAATALKNRPIKIIFIGDGQLKQEMMELSKNNKNVVYLPPMENNRLPLYINAADVVWGASSVTYLGLTLIEALACGKPIISTTIPYSVDLSLGITVDPKTIPPSIGYIVQENTADIVKLLDRLMKNKNILKSKQTACLAFYRREYGRNNVDKILYELFCS